MMYRRDHIAAFFALLGLAGFLLFSASSAHAQAASLYLSPSSINRNAGDSFSVTIRVNTDSQAINAAQGSLTFDPAKLEVSGVSKAGSIFNLWTEDPTYSNAEGTIDFEGGLPNPGYSGSSGLLATITFHVKPSARGSSTVALISGAILANDGQGTNILASLGQLSLAIGAASQPQVTQQPTQASQPSPESGAPTVQSSTHPDPTKWYSNANPQFTWQLPGDATGVSYLVTDAATSNPGPNSDGLKDSVSFTNIADGTHYFHLKFKEGGAWGSIAHFKFNIDTQGPRDFQIQLVQNSPNIQPQIQFSTTDDLSGIDHYEIRLGEQGDWVHVGADQAGKPYQLSFDQIGTKTVYVKAVDGAGNTTVESLPVTISSAQISMSILDWVGKAFNVTVDFVSANSLLIAFLLALIGFLILFAKLFHGVMTNGWRHLSDRRAIRKAEHNADDTLEHILDDMRDEIKFLNTIGKRRKLGPEERYLKSKIEQYAKSLRKYDRAGGKGSEQ